MRIPFLFVLLATALAMAIPQRSHAQAPSAARHEFVYIQATGTKNIYVIDATTFQVVREIPIGDLTDDVIGSPDGKLAFANAQIALGSPLSPTNSEAGKVMAISTATGKILWSTYVDGVPNHLAVDPSGSRVFVPLFNRDWLLVLDAHSGRVIDRWYSVIGNHGLEMSRDGRRLYVGNMITDAIWVYDTASGRVVHVLQAGEAVRPLKLDPDETHIVYQLSRFHGFKVRDLKTGDIRSVDLPALPPGAPWPKAFPFTVDHGLAFTPDHRKLLANGSIGGYVAVYSVPDYRLLGTIKIGDDSNWIAVRADSKIAFISNRGSNTLSVVDLDAMKEIKQIPVGKVPQRLSIIDVPVAR
ncbi:MAG: YncE family protein [Caulobacteraceae bacterium]